MKNFWFLSLKYLIVLIVIPLALNSGCALKGMPMDFLVITHGGTSSSQPQPPVEFAAKSASQAREGLARMGDDMWVDSHAKLFTDNIDYGRYMLLLISPGPQGSTGVDVRIDNIREEESRIVVYYSRQFQQVGGATVTTPFAIVKTRLSDKPVEFVFRR